MRPQDRLYAVILRSLLGLLIWWLLTEGRSDGLWFGVPVVVLAVALSLYLQPPVAWRLSFSGALAFWWFFSLRSLLAGLDVARRVLSRSMPIQPGSMTLQTELPAGAPRWLLAMTLSLLPGTLSVRLSDNQLLLHCLDLSQPVEDEFRLTELKISRLFVVKNSRFNDEVTE